MRDLRCYQKAPRVLLCGRIPGDAKDWRVVVLQRLSSRKRGSAKGICFFAIPRRFDTYRNLALGNMFKNIDLDSFAKIFKRSLFSQPQNRPTQLLLDDPRCIDRPSQALGSYPSLHGLKGRAWDLSSTGCGSATAL